MTEQCSHVFEGTAYKNKPASYFREECRNEATLTIRRNDTNEEILVCFDHVATVVDPIRQAWRYDAPRSLCGRCGREIVKREYGSLRGDPFFASEAWFSPSNQQTVTCPSWDSKKDRFAFWCQP